MNINVFPNLAVWQSYLVFAISFEETDSIWYGTAIDDVDGTIGEDVLNISTLCACVCRRFSEIGEVDDITN